jgi:hypothetical protein
MPQLVWPVRLAGRLEMTMGSVQSAPVMSMGLIASGT